MNPRLQSLDRFAFETPTVKITTPASSRPEGGGPKQALLEGLTLSRRELMNRGLHFVDQDAEGAGVNGCAVPRQELG